MFLSRKCCVSFKRDGTHVFETLSQKASGGHQCDFWIIWDGPSSYHCPVSVSWWNHVNNWHKVSEWGLDFLRSSPVFFCGFLDKLLMGAWIGRPATPGNIHQYFLHLEIMALTVVFWSPRTLQMAFSRLIYFNNFHEFWDSFWSWHTVLFVETFLPTSHCRKCSF